MKAIPIKLIAVLALAVLLGGCASTPTGGTNLVSGEGQTLGGYVATGAIDADNADGAKTGDDDETAPEPPPPPPMK